MDLDLLQQQLRTFAEERNWQPFHTPKNLAMALMVESAELLEVFQWMTPEESQGVKHNPVEKAKAADEVADVLLYLLQLADQLQIDIPQAVGQKLLKNALKHPPPAARQVAAPSVLDAKEALPSYPVPASESSENVHVLIDWENVQPSWVEVRALVPDCTHVWLLHGPHQKKMDAGYQSLGDRFTSVPSVQSGKNSLDFQLSFYCGYLASKKGKRLVVLANDLGYEPMVKHAKLLGFDAIRLGFVAKNSVDGKSDKSSTPAKETDAKPELASLPVSAGVPLSAAAVAAKLPMPSTKLAENKLARPVAKKAEATVVAAQSAQSPAAGKKSLKPMPGTTAAQHARRLLKSWSENNNRPVSAAKLLNAIKANTGSASIDAPMVQLVFSVLKARKDIDIDASGEKVHYHAKKQAV